MESDMTVEETNSHFAKNGHKRTWSELRQEVRTVRRHVYSISSKVPTYFNFKEMQNENGSSFFRIYFLSTISTGRETTLLYCDVSMDNITSKDTSKAFVWQPLLESTFQTYQSQGRFSREEQLQWERKRVVNWGITSYDFQLLCSRFIFPACGSVFYCDDDGTQVPPFFPQELKSSTDRARLNPQMCPWNADLVAYVHNCDLWVYHVTSLCDIRLTYVKRGAELAEDPVSAGIPSYVTQEEFNRYTGYWWQPAETSGSRVYRILYEEVDEGDVELLRVPCYTDEKELEEYRFPRAGTSNAKSTLKIVQFTLNASNQVEVLSHLALNETLHAVCPDYEYLVRAGWTPDGKSVWAQVLDRQQTHEQLVLIPLSAFISSGPVPYCRSDLNHVENEPSIQVIYEEKSDVWINVHDVLHFFPQESKDKLKFLWASEESGYRHLYIIQIELYLDNDFEISSTSNINQHKWNISNRKKKKVALTSGDWEVSEQDVWVNENKNIVFFIGLKDTPLERHLYAVDMEKPDKPLRLTTARYSHTVAMSNDHTLFVSIQSNVSEAPFGQVYLLQYSQSGLTTVAAYNLGYFLEPSNIISTYPYPELFEHRLKSDDVIYGMLFRPNNMKLGEKYPTVLTIYGGPEVQLVSNSFKGMRSLRQFLLVSQGYVVVAVDCRGSRHRGVAFESHIKGRMGTVEIADHVEVLLWLSETKGFIDLQRVAVHGWSYGGYLSLMALAQRPDIFKIAVAGAPVTSWLLYDTGYTERYMNIPSKNVPGYSTGSVLSYIHQFPDEENRLLIIHGLMDENVHFRHTTQLINALIKCGKPYQLQVYPTERHSLRHLDASEHYETTLLSFLQQHL